MRRRLRSSTACTDARPFFFCRFPGGKSSRPTLFHCFILRFTLYCQIFLAVYRVPGVSHRQKVHKNSIKGVFYAGLWCGAATAVMLLVLCRACDTPEKPSG